MQLVFADDILPQQVRKTIFLAGPNPRYNDGDAIQTTWRHNALSYLEERGFDGHVFIPLPKGSFFGDFVVGAVSDYDHQIKWEDDAMARADVIVFYVPRSKELQGLTTNIEFGRYLDSGRIVYGRPDDALNTRYLDEQMAKRKRPVYGDSSASIEFGTLLPSLINTLEAAIVRCGEGVLREGGAVHVPQLYWNSPQFQDWYKNMITNTGNELRGFDAKTVITFNNDQFLFGFAAWVNVFVTGEDREKSNEWIFSRTYTSYVAPYYIDPVTGQHKYVLVREFRSPANNPAGYIFELPGGSSTDGKGINPFVNAQKEMEEETGLCIDDISRFRFLGNRQTFSTFSINKIFATSVELTKVEFEMLEQSAKSGTVFGENSEERIKLFIATGEELIDNYDEMPVDYTTLGIIHLTEKLKPQSSEFNHLTTWLKDAEHGLALKVLRNFEVQDVLEERSEWSKEGLNALLHRRLVQKDKEGSTIAETEAVFRITSLGKHILSRVQETNKSGFGAV